MGRVWWQSRRGGTPMCAVMEVPVRACGGSAPGGGGKNCCKAERGSDRVATGTPSSAGPRLPVVGKLRAEESLTKSGRAFSSTAPQINHKNYLWARYNEMKRLVHGKNHLSFVFCKNESDYRLHSFSSVLLCHCQVK